MDQENRRTYLFYKFLDQIGLNRVFRYLLSGRPKIVMYHGVIDDSDDIECWWLIKKTKFTNQIKYIKRNFNIISMDEVHACISANQDLPKNACVLTFDDGYKNYLTKVLPILKAEELPSTVYIAAGISADQSIIWTDRLFYAFYKSNKSFLDLIDMKLGMWRINPKNEKIRSAYELINLLKRVLPQDKNRLIEEIITRLYFQDDYQDLNGNNPFAVLSVEDIQKLSLEPLVTIGSHSVSHEILPNLSRNELEKEISMSKCMLEQWIHKPVKHFAYPDGKYDLTVAELVKKAGYKTASRIGLGIFRSNHLFEINRLAVGAGDNNYLFKSMINGVTTMKIEVKMLLRKLFSMKSSAQNFSS